MHVSTNADCFSLCSSYPHLVDIDAKQSTKWQVCHLVVSDPVAPRCKSVLGPMACGWTHNNNTSHQCAKNLITKRSHTANAHKPHPCVGQLIRLTAHVSRHVGRHA